MKFIQNALCLVLVALVAACSSNKPVSTFDGDLDEGQLSVLEVPASINILAVNGKRMPSYLLEDIAVNYGLKPGRNTVDYEFATLWATSRVGDEKSSTLVKSERKSLIFTAQPGARYKIEAPMPENIREAKSVAAVFEAEVIDQNLSIVSREYVEEPKSESAEEMQVGLEQLKELWVKISAEDKQAFLKWALQ